MNEIREKLEIDEGTKLLLNNLIVEKLKNMNLGASAAEPAGK